MTEDGGRIAQAFRSSMSPCLVVRFRNQRPKSRPHLRDAAAFASLSSCIGRVSEQYPVSSDQ